MIDYFCQGCAYHIRGRRCDHDPFLPVVAAARKVLGIIQRDGTAAVLQATRTGVALDVALGELASAVEQLAPAFTAQTVTANCSFCQSEWWLYAIPHRDGETYRACALPACIQALHELLGHEVAR